jgi:hypothetical protein
MNFSSTPQLELALEFVQSTGKNIFLTGKAGTGKTTFLHNLKRFSSKRLIVVAPTGVAAINAGGVTIHSFFQLSFGPQLPSDIQNQASQNRNDSSRIQRFSREKIDIIRSLDLLVIDEVSMVRADLLDGIDSVLRRFKNRLKPFGGVQLLMIGDLQQLAPIAKDDEWAILKDFYDTVFFFSSMALRKTSFVSIELNHIFRQSDKRFIDLLNKVRNNELDLEGIAMLNERFIPNFSPNENEGYITLTTHNHQAQSINSAKLSSIKAKPETFKALVEGDFPEFAYPTDFELTLKEGAQVMFIKNDLSPEKQFFNGKIGKVEHIDEDIIYVKCPSDENVIEVTPLKWENTKYTIDQETKEIKENVTGIFTQYPLKLAWAITIHKSQGLTFDRAIIDAQAAFAHGQVYVALSRCRTFEGLVLTSKVSTNAIITDKTVIGFSKEVENNQPTKQELTAAQLEYQKELLMELFDFQQIQKNLDYTTRFFKDNASSFPPGICDEVSTIANSFKGNIYDVAVKFTAQVDYLIRDYGCVETNISLQDRIKKSVSYFVPKLDEQILQSIADMDYESDSVDLKSKAKEHIEKISKAIAEKIICLKGCENGFNVTSFIDVRAKAAIEGIRKKKKAKENDSIPVTSTENVELYNRLKRWRDALALKSNLRMYRILRQNTLYEIASQLPYDKVQLKAINGLGAKKIADFGNDILELVKAYRLEIGLTNPQGNLYEDEKNKSTIISNTLDATLELFKQGKTVEQIAEERGMAISSIANHLTRFVSSGQISAEDLVENDKFTVIKEYFVRTNDPKLKLAKEALGDNYSYNELRWVLKHLQLKGDIKDFFEI